MHLTNYAINKSSKDFIRDDDVGSKRKLTVVNKWFLDNGYDIKKIWNDIDVSIISFTFGVLNLIVLFNSDHCMYVICYV